MICKNIFFIFFKFFFNFLKNFTFPKLKGFNWEKSHFTPDLKNKNIFLKKKNFFSDNGAYELFVRKVKGSRIFEPRKNPPKILHFCCCLFPLKFVQNYYYFLLYFYALFYVHIAAFFLLKLKKYFF